MRSVGDAGQQLAVFFVELFGAFVEGGGAVSHFADLLLAFGRVLAGFDQLANFLRFAFALGFELFGFSERSAALAVELAEGFDVEREAAIRQS